MTHPTLIAAAQDADALPPETVQRMDALERANTVREDRAKLKRDLKAGRKQITDVLREIPECVQNAKVTELLLVLPKYGRVKVDKVLAHSRISPTTRFGALDDQQRDALVRALNSQAPRRPATSPVRAR